MTKPEKSFLYNQDRLALLGAWLFSIVIVIYPIFDFDLYWHLANGREMVNAGRIVSEEIFSYTHPGESFANHEWLSQIIFYFLWHHFGPYGLFGLKLLIATFIVILLYRTIRFIGTPPLSAAVLCVFAIFAGINRFHERPELFSLLNIALLSFILYGFRLNQLPRKLLWLIPLQLVIWDWLHGAIFGFTFLTLFVVGENAKYWLPLLRRGQSLATKELISLNRCFSLTVLAMLINPLGLRSYGIFMGYVTGEADFNQVITEFMPVTWEESEIFIILLAWTALLALRHLRRIDLTQLLLIAVFGCATLRFTRVAGISAIVLAPVIASLLSVNRSAKIKLDAWLNRAMLMLAVIIILFHGYHVKFSGAMQKDDDYHYLEMYDLAFDDRVDNNFYPVGAVNFIKAMGLSGNLYNSGNFGGYLAYNITPDRKIFQYNMGRVFGDPFYYEEHPTELNKWNINYALVDTEAELSTLFPETEWAEIYRDPAAVLMLKRTAQNATLINQYEIHFFHPVLSDKSLRKRAVNPDILPRLVEEMGISLAYRKDDRIANLWAELLIASPKLRNQQRIQELLLLALKYNNTGKLAQLKPDNVP